MAGKYMNSPRLRFMSMKPRPALTTKAKHCGLGNWTLAHWRLRGLVDTLVLSGFEAAGFGGLGVSVDSQDLFTLHVERRSCREFLEECLGDGTQLDNRTTGFAPHGHPPCRCHAPLRRSDSSVAWSAA